MTILWEFDEKHPNQVGAYGTELWAIPRRPSGTQFGEGSRHADSEALIRPSCVARES